MASNIASGTGGAVLESGKNKIENIFVRGEMINAINDIALENQINVFPNPTDGLINLGTDLRIESVQVLSVMGKLQKELKNNGLFKNIDLTELPAGNYIIRFKIVGDTNIAVKKLTIL